MAAAGGQQVAAAMTPEQVDAEILYYRAQREEAARDNDKASRLASDQALAGLYQQRALMGAGAAGWHTAVRVLSSWCPPVACQSKQVHKR